MKPKFYLTTFFLLISIIAFGKVEQTQKITSVPSNNVEFFDINGIDMAVLNNGLFASVNFESGYYQQGFIYHNTQFIYSSGLWLAAMVDTNERASSAIFLTDFTPGAIGSDGLHYGENDSVLFRVYKISRGDTPETNPDYADWPAQLGAPVDENGNPKIFGDQTLWCSFSDAYLPERKFNLPPALNAEVHLTAWGWQDIENVVFLRWEVINKSDKSWENAYLGFYVDPDVASANDDLVGSDSTINLVYTYDSGKYFDYDEMNSLGYVYLQTPLQFSPGDTAFLLNENVIDFKNVPASSPLALKHLPYEWTEIPFRADSTSQLVYRRLRCLDNYGDPMINPVTGKRTYWALSGDPLAGTGWLDPVPDDRRMMLSSGPFDLAPGDTNSAVLAIIPVTDKFTKNSIFNLKQQSGAVQSFFRNGMGFYTERTFAEPGQQNVVFSIDCINQKKIKQIDFTIPALPEDLKFARAALGDRTKDFFLNTQTDPQTGAVNISVSSSDSLLTEGQGEIARLFFDIYPGAQVGTYPVLITNVNTVDENNVQYNDRDLNGVIELQTLPQSPTLLSPEPGKFIDGMKVDFAWSSVSAVDSFSYKLRILGEHGYRAKTDTNYYTIPVHDFISGNETDTIKWYVEVSGKEFSVYSTDTSYFIVPSPEQLKIDKFKQTWTFPAFLDSGHIVLARIDSSYIYTIAVVETGFFSSQYGIQIATVENGNFQVISTQQIPVPTGMKAFFVDKNRLFIVGEDMIFCFSINEDLSVRYKSTYHFTENFIDGKIIGNHLFFLVGNELQILDISDMTEVTLLTIIDLSDWRAAGQSILGRRMKIFGDSLFVAFGVHWGVFDISDPASPNLLVRVKTPYSVSAIAHEDSKVYVGSHYGWLGMYDVTNIANSNLIYQEYLGNYHIDKIDVFDDHIYLPQRPIVQVCHYETGKYFIQDGIFNYDDAVYVTPTRFYNMHLYGNKIDVYENRVLTAVEKELILEKKFSLSQNYPNPFNPQTEITYQLPQTSYLELTIFNLQGQKVKTLFSGQQPAGMHRVKWNGVDQNGTTVASGIYLCRMRTGDFVATRKMLLLR